ncbi:MAG: fimbrillin family protein [Bacteroidales bacterium]
MKKINFMKWICLPCMVLSIFYSCSKDTIYIYPDSDSNKDNANTNDKTYPVSFSAVMLSLNLTKSMFTFPQGRYATVFVYNQGQTPSDVPIESANYTTKSSGILSPLAANIFLTNGEYDFYSVATNSTTNRTPTFSKGTSSALSNGVDYLWWKTPKYAISGTAANIDIVYTHSCSQIVIQVTGGNGITINSIDSAKITPPVTTGTMDLGTGQIPSATSLSTNYLKMGVAQNTCQATLLPLKTSDQMSVVLYIKVNNETTPRTYAVSVPVPGDVLVAGDSYLFKAIVNATTITFPSVSVIGWVVVNEQGEPLYPGEIN